MITRTRHVYQSKLVDPDTEWTRRRLQILLGAVAVVVLAMAAGGVWSVVSMLTGSPAGDGTGSGSAQSAQDQLADKQLPDAPLEAAQPGSLSSGETGTLEIPAPTKVGEVGVATGFPHTPEGAMAQLAAIDTTALTSASVRVAQEVITAWAAPGGPTAESWTGVQGLAALLESAGMTSEAQNTITIAVEPKMGFIKGTVGDDFVIPCIDFIITATTASGQPQQVAAADCQRMVWQDGRWVIGEGEEPATSPSLWPGSQASFDAGYQWLEAPPVMSTRTVAGIVPMIDLNPLNWLGDKAKEGLADGFTSMMMSIWSGAVWLLKTAFGLIDNFTPNVADPDLAKLYSVTLWIALVTALVMAFGQIGSAVLRQDGRGFGTLAAGVVQYGVVLTCWITVSAGLIAAASGLTKGILDTLLGVDSFSGYAAGDGFVDQISGTTQAAVLGICGLFVLIPAAFGHMIIMMVRSASLLILVATMPIAAAGALSEGTKSWMWKSVRWFLACVLMEPLLALVVGMGTQFAWAGMPDGEESTTEKVLHFSSTSANIGTSVVGSIIMLVACFMPLVLFRMLAFVDPGTASGASFRSTMDANGGAAGLLRGKTGGGEASGSGAATATSSDGRTSSESGAEAETANRFQSSGLKKVGGKVGGFVGGAMEKTGKVAQAGAAMSVDVLGQGGIGNQGYYPTEHDPKKNKKAHQMKPFNDTNGDGVANDIPPQAQQAVDVAEEDPEVFLA